MACCDGSMDVIDIAESLDIYAFKILSIFTLVAFKVLHDKSIELVTTSCLLSIASFIFVKKSKNFYKKV